MAAQTLTITFSDREPLTVQPNLYDTLNLETTLRQKKHWGTLQENLLKSGPFRAWSAAKRLGLIDVTWEDFSGQNTTVLDVSADAPDEDEEDEGAAGFLA